MKLPSFTSFHEDVNVIGSLSKINEPDDIGVIDFLTDLYFRFDSLNDVDSKFLLLLIVLSVLNL